MATTTGTERRFLRGRELRVEGDGAEIRVSGYAGVTNSWSEDLGGFQEIIEPGAFADAIGVSDVRCLFNHDGITLARCRNGASDGTMTLEEDDTGLRFDATMDGTSPVVMTLVSAIRRGDVDGCSFAFNIDEAGDRWEDDGTVTRRAIVKIARIFDVGPVNFPAYPDTTVALRSLQDARAARDVVGAQRRGAISIRRRRLELDAA